MRLLWFDKHVDRCCKQGNESVRIIAQLLYQILTFIEMKTNEIITIKTLSLNILLRFIAFNTNELETLSPSMTNIENSRPIQDKFSCLIEFKQIMTHNYQRCNEYLIFCTNMTFVKVRHIDSVFLYYRQEQVRHISSYQ